jgi:hypothetical protein
MTNDYPAVDVPCLECGMRPSRVLAATETGTYFYCEACNGLWYKDDLPREEPKQPASGDQPRRRKGDRK